MKKFHLAFLAALICLTFNSCSSLTGVSTNLDKISNVGLFIIKRPVKPQVDCYSYMSQNPFSQNRQAVLSHLGEEWGIVESDAATIKRMQTSVKKRSKDQKVEGISSFYSPRYGEKRIIILQLKKAGKPSILLIYEESQ